MRTLKYRFITEETITIEVSDEWGDTYKIMKREEWRTNKSASRHTTNFSDMEDKDLFFPSSDNDPYEMIAEAERQEERRAYQERVQAALSRLNSSQREMIEAIFVKGASQAEYAASKGVSQAAISQRLDTIRKKLEKLLK